MSLYLVMYVTSTMSFTVAMQLLGSTFNFLYELKLTAVNGTLKLVLAFSKGLHFCGSYSTVLEYYREHIPAYFLAS